jgi:hypothetical protein
MAGHKHWIPYFILEVALFLGVAVTPGFSSGELFIDADGAQVLPFQTGRAMSDPTVVRSRWVRVDFDLLRGDSLSEGASSIVLNLFDDISFQTIKDRFERRSSTGYTWIGRIAGTSISQVILTVEDDVLAGNILADGEPYQVRAVHEGTHAIRRIDQSQFPEEAPPIPAPIPSDKAETFSPLPQADDGTLIDVLVVYTAAAANASSSINAEIQLAIDETNQTYVNSGVTQRVRLVHAAQVSYTETGHGDVDLVRLQNPSDGYLDEVHTLRDAYGADLVSFWVENMGNDCGIGYLMTAVLPSFASHGFSVVARDCATGYYSFGHEMGHNMGAHHDRYLKDGDGAYPYSHGYVYTPGRWRTVMAYNQECADKGFNCTRIPYWSNPAVDYQGIPTGISEDSQESANNRLTLEHTASTVANFRTSTLPSRKPNLTPYQPQGWSDKIVVSGARRTKTDTSPLPPMGPLYVDFAVINDSDVSIPSTFSMALYVDGALEGTWTGDGLDPHSYAFVTDYSMGALSPGTHTLKIVADSTGVISESDEGDNAYTKTIVVSAPDLTGGWISPPAQSCRSSARGQSCGITGSLIVSNIGKWKATSSYVDIYLSGVDGDSLIKRISTGTLQPGASKTLKINYSLPLNGTATGKSFKAVIDPDNTVQESDETNNTAVSGPIQ